MIKKTIIATDDQGVVFGRRDQKHRSGKLWENCYKLHPLDLDVYYVVLRYIERGYGHKPGRLKHALQTLQIGVTCGFKIYAVKSVYYTRYTCVINFSDA